MPFKGAVNTFLVYQFVRELTRSWEEMRAYDLGIIDKEGKLLKKVKDLVTQEERESYTLFHRLVWNIKRMLEQLPGGASKIKSYAAALWLLKENKDLIFNQLQGLIEEKEIFEVKMMIEEVAGPINVVSGVATKDIPLCQKKKKKKEVEVENKSSIAALRRKISEGKALKKVIRGGVLKRKIICPEGQVAKGGKCVPKTSKEKQTFIKAAKKRKRSMAGKSLVAAQRKRAKSVRKRTATGI